MMCWRDGYIPPTIIPQKIPTSVKANLLRPKPKEDSGIFYTPQQLIGLWTDDRVSSPHISYGLMRLWLRENGEGKIFEMYHGSLVEADVRNFRNVEGKISFEKKYRRTGRDLGLHYGRVDYEGHIKFNGLIEGRWRFGSDPSSQEGNFYFADIIAEDQRRILGSILLDLEGQNLVHRIANLRLEFPYG